MLVILFLLWMLLNGRWTVELAVAGLVLSGIMYLMLCKLTKQRLFFDLRMIVKLPAVVELLAVLLLEICKANLQVIHWIWSLKETEVKPEIVSFQSGLRTEPARAALVCCITLTPGTIVADLKEDTFTVHCLDHSLAEELDRSGFIRCLKKLEG